MSNYNYEYIIEKMERREHGENCKWKPEANNNCRRKYIKV